jgi:signal transduction histidine kinase
LRLSIAARLAASYGLLVMVAVAGVAGIFYGATIGLLERSIDREIETVARRLVDHYRSHSRDDLSAALAQELKDGTDSDDEILLLISPAGTILAGNLTSWPVLDVPAETLQSTWMKRRGQQTRVRFLLHELGDGNRLLVGRDMREQQAMRALVLEALAVGALVAVALVLGGTLYFRRQLERPIGAIRRAAHEIESGDLSRRMPSLGDDEFGGLATDINRMLDRIEQLMNGVRHVSNSIAHDLRTPLTRIRSQLETALRNGGEATDPREAIATAIAGIDDLILLFNRLLQIAETESGVHARNFSAIDVNRIAEDMVELYDASAEEQGIELALTARRGQTTLGDHNLVASALASLIDNAMKYAGAGARIEVAALADEVSVSLRVRDDGPGISPAELPFVRQRFYRVDPSRSLPGNGLGLSIVEAIATLHGGRLELENLSRGFEARLVLPRRRDVAQEALTSARVASGHCA